MNNCEENSPAFISKKTGHTLKKHVWQKEGTKYAQYLEQSEKLKFSFLGQNEFDIMTKFEDMAAVYI